MNDHDLLGLLMGDLADTTTRFVLADCLMEHDREVEAILARDIKERIAVRLGRVMRFANFWHSYDPRSMGNRWSFCYLDGEAQDWNRRERIARGWPDEAESSDDRFDADAPMPREEGEYAGTLYGLPVVCVLRFRGEGRIMEGRVVNITDTEALKHAFNPEEWR